MVSVLPSSTSLTGRLVREREHFDAHYTEEAAAGVARLSDFDRVRYDQPPADTLYPREFYYHLLGPLAGKRVLEIACGNGIDTTLMAAYGARVHAYDISDASIQLTRRRLALHNLDAQLECTGSLDDAFAGESFDLVIGYAALHHLDLASLGQRIAARLRPGGYAVFAEPVVNSPGLAALRRLVPIALDEMTDDERPLRDADFR